MRLHPEAGAQEAPARWDVVTEVLIVGFGGAGATAAVTACKHDAEVLVLEESDRGGGITMYAGAAWLPHNPVQEANGYNDSVEEGFEYLWKTTRGQAREEVVRAFVENSYETLSELLDETGLQPGFGVWDDFQPSYPGAKNSRLVRFSCRDYFRRLHESLEARGGRVMTRTRARHLYTDPNGGVVGVRAEGANGENLNIGAGRAVILCAGGFSRNEEMKRSFFRIVPVPSVVSTGGQGDGLLMGMGAGAMLGNMKEYAPEFEGQLEDGRAFRAPYSHPHAILVDRLGRRFINESEDYPTVGTGFYGFDGARDEYRYLPAFVVIDSEGADQTGLSRQEAVIKGDDIKELADRSGIDPSRLSETVDRYNRNIKEGRDPDFLRGVSKGSRGEEPEPLEGPPFYSIRIYPRVLDTMGGLEINGKAQVLNAASGKPIPGLYAAGNNAHQALGFYYQGGGSVGNLMVFGRLAGINAAKRV